MMVILLTRSAGEMRVVVLVMMKIRVAIITATGVVGAAADNEDGDDDDDDHPCHGDFLATAFDSCAQNAADASSGWQRLHHMSAGWSSQ